MVILPSCLLLCTGHQVIFDSSYLPISCNALLLYKHGRVNISFMRPCSSASWKIAYNLKKYKDVILKIIGQYALLLWVYILFSCMKTTFLEKCMLCMLIYMIYFHPSYLTVYFKWLLPYQQNVSDLFTTMTKPKTKSSGLLLLILRITCNPKLIKCLWVLSLFELPSIQWVP